MAGAPLEVPIPDRAAAGRALAGLLADHGGPDTRVLALPRGGVPVAYEIAEALESPLDLLLVRKLGVPGHSELAMGAIASGDVRVFNEDILRSLGIGEVAMPRERRDRKSTRLNSSHVRISYAVFCLKKKKKKNTQLLAR